MSSSYDKAKSHAGNRQANRLPGQVKGWHAIIQWSSCDGVKTKQDEWK